MGTKQGLLDNVYWQWGVWLGVTAVITTLSLTINPAFTALYILIIIASIVSKNWKIPLFLGLLSISLNVGLLIYWQGLEQSLTEIAINLLIMLLVTAISTFISQRWSQEINSRIELEKKLQVRADKYLMRAHEIRTPLSLIRASVELILDGNPGPITKQQQVFLENIDENSQHIALLAENMLTKGKLESGIFQPTLQPTDIRTPIREVVADMRTFTERRNQTIRTYHPQILPSVNVDPVLLRQVVMNLIQNAIRHTSSGGKIIISVVENDLNLLISVTDDGAGMTPEQREQLFHRFQSGSGGTGLGLLIVKQIIELHGGKVLVDTNLGRGTTFLLTLPFSSQQSERG